LIEAKLTVTTRSGKLETRLRPLEVASIFASRYKFDDLDLEPTDGGFRIVASSKGRQVTVKRPTVELAVERLLEVFSNE
jgi:hypothetical protein